MNEKKENCLLFILALFKIWDLVYEHSCHLASSMFFAENMKSIRDWAFSQLLTQSLASSLPLCGSNRFFNREKSTHELGGQGSSNYFAFSKVQTKLSSFSPFACDS